MSNNNHEISLQEAIEMTTRFRENIPAGMPLSEKFDVSAITKLTSTEGCKFVRIYYGMKENLEVHAILVAVNEQDEDLLPSEDGNEMNSSNDDHIILEDALRCPPVCPKPSPLNLD